MFGKKLLLILMVLFAAPLAEAQLSNFTLTVAKTDETCNSNATLTFTVSGTTTGATMLFSIYQLPNLTAPISVQSGLSISGLAAGNYRVVATQSLGSGSGQQYQEIAINNAIHALTYQLTTGSANELCGSDGKIQVNVLTGTAVSYELFSGPIIRPLQTSNVFANLVTGTYQVRVIDACGEAVVQTYTVQRQDTRLTIAITNTQLVSCTTVNLRIKLGTVLPEPLGMIKFPLLITTTVTPTTGPPVVLTQNFTSLQAPYEFIQPIPFYVSQPYQYTIAVTDGCGTVYTYTDTIHDMVIPPIIHYPVNRDCTHQDLYFINITALTMTAAPAIYTGTVPQVFSVNAVGHSYTLNALPVGTYTFDAADLCGVVQHITVEIVSTPAAPPYFALTNQSCSGAIAYIFNVQQLILVSAPPGFGVALPHDYSSQLANYFVILPVFLPVGTYVFTIMDRCGQQSTMTMVINPVTIPCVIHVLEGCTDGQGSVEIGGQLASVTLASGPTTYAGTHDFTPGIRYARVGIDSLPAGDYVFQATDSCGQIQLLSATIQGYQDHTDVTILPNCGSFDFNLQHTSNNNTAAQFWFQQYNPQTNVWYNPANGQTYSGGTLTTSNAMPLTNNAVNYNFAYTGHFRILKVYNVFGYNAPSTVQCTKVIKEFDFSAAPRIVGVYSIACGTTYEAIVDAVGNSALIYRITDKDGQPFLIENGASNLFSGLAPAIYNFQVEDACGNRLNSAYDVASPSPMLITAGPIPCGAGSLSMTVPNFTILTYQWWKGSDNTTILSTLNTLNFPAFNAVTDGGTYHVRISYSGNPNSCFNQVLNYTLNVGDDTPNAGNDATASYCGRQGTVDLMTLLSGNFDSTGTWTEITSSGMLANNLWDSSNVPFATYQFRYTVTGSCNLVDDSVISITLKPIPAVPVASADPSVCESGDLQLFATTVPSGSYSWIGPNGFTSTLQNPIITAISASQNGIYTVHSEQNECRSGTSAVTVLVNPMPGFVLHQDCVGRDYQVWATPTGDGSYDEANATFSWTGPNNFTSNQNPITITGGALGTYILTIANQQGCEKTNSIEVLKTNCFIPNVITPNNDQLNESFDLTGYDVAKLEIYNRWGRKVYEKNNYLNEWHGQNMNGGILPDSTYYYIITLGAEAQTKTGWIFLNRG